MKKFLLTLIVTMLAFVGAWAQGGYDVSINGSKATVTSGGSKTLEAVASEIGSNSDVTTVIMPSGWTTSQLKTFADQITAVKTAVSTTSSTKEVPAYYYDVETNKTEYTGERGSEDGHITGTVPTIVSLTKTGESYAKASAPAEAYNGIVFVKGGKSYGIAEGVEPISITATPNVYTYNSGASIYDAETYGVSTNGYGYINSTSQKELFTKSAPSYKYTNGGIDYLYEGNVYQNNYSAYYAFNDVLEEVKCEAVSWQYNKNWSLSPFSGTPTFKNGKYYGEVDGEEIEVLPNELLGSNGTTYWTNNTPYRYDSTGDVYVRPSTFDGAKQVSANDGDVKYYLSETEKRIYKESSDGKIYVTNEHEYIYSGGQEVALTFGTIYKDGSDNIYTGMLSTDGTKGLSDESVAFELASLFTYSYVDPSDNLEGDAKNKSFDSAEVLTEKTIDRIVYLTQGTKEVPAGNELVMYTKEEGCAKTYIDGLDYSVKSDVNAITLAGEVSVADLNKVADLSVVAVMDVRETSITNVSGFVFEHWGETPKLIVLANGNVNQKDFFGTNNTIAQIISEGTAGSLNVGIRDAALLDINPYITSENHAIILSNYGSGQLAGAPLLEKINNLPASILNVDLSKGSYAEADFNLSSLTNSYMKYLTLEDETDLAATLKGKTLPENIEIVASAKHKVRTDYGGGNVIDEDIYYTNIRKQGALDGAEGLVSDAVMQADKVCFSGYMSSSDLANFTYNQNKKLDFSQVVFDGTDFTALNNAYVEYIALPNNLTSDFATGTDNVTVVNKTNLPKLKGIGCYTEKTVEYMQNSIVEEEGKNLITQTVKNGKCGILSLHDFTGTLEKNQVSEEKSYDLCHNQIVSVMVAEHNTTMVVDSLRLSGYLNHNDIVNGDGKGINVTINTSNKMTPRGIDMSCAYFNDQDDMVLSTAGWAVASLNFVSFPKDSRMKKIPTDCLKNYSNIYSLTIPNHYEYIGAGAFYNLNCLLHQTVLVYENDNDCEPEVLDYGTEKYPYAVTLPASLKYVGTGAYWLDEHISDVYNLAKTAPICAKDAFSSGTLVGWGGFHNVSPITRDSYGSDVSLANASAKSFGILHWPALISEDNVKRYTDITRKYSIVDELQTTDGDGNTYVWPNQSEYNRAYGQASNGYLWTGWGNLYGVDQDAAGNATYYNVVTIDQTGSDKMYTDAVFLENYAKYEATKSSQVFDDCVGVSPVSINNIYKIYGDGTVLPATNGKVTMFAGTEYEETVDVDYRGWHQFVLTGSAQYEEPTEEPTWDANTYVESDWYTMCVPFDMTEDDCLQIFGVKAVEGTKTIVSRDNGTTTLATGDTQVPLICSLKDVVRDQPNNKITLNFSSNVARTHKEWTPYSSTESKTKNQYNECDEVEGKKIIVKAGYPYLVRVFLPQSGQIDTKYQTVAGEGAAQRAKRLMEHENSSADRDFDNTEKAKKPYDKWSVYSYAPGDKTTPLMDDRAEHASEPYTYKFVGTYEAADNIPMWAFFLANNGTKNVFYRNIWEPDVYSAPWNANSCMIGAKAELEMKRMGTSTALYSSLKPSLACEDDVFGAAKNETNSGKRAAMFMNFSDVEDDNATMIEYIEANGHIVEATKQDVYNLNGVKVSSYGIDSLPKGIYVVNGKKIVK